MPYVCSLRRTWTTKCDNQKLSCSTFKKSRRSSGDFPSFLRPVVRKDWSTALTHCCDSVCWQATNRLTPSFFADTGYSLIGWLCLIYCILAWANIQHVLLVSVPKWTSLKQTFPPNGLMETTKCEIFNSTAHHYDNTMRIICYGIVQSEVTIKIVQKFITLWEIIHPSLEMEIPSTHCTMNMNKPTSSPTL